MLPWKSIIDISKTRSRAIYLQISDSIIEEIIKGRIPKGYKMPGSRILAKELNLNRKTINNVYDELLAQGWLEIVPSKGTFVKDNLPMMNYQRIEHESNQTNTNFIESIDILPFKENKEFVLPENVIDDGSPDYRLAPIESLYKATRTFTKGRLGRSTLLNGSSYGEISLRKTLNSYLSNTRAINGDVDNILVTRGSQMALYLLFNVLIKKGDNVIVGELNYHLVNTIVNQVGGKLNRVPVDQFGLEVDYIEALCKKKPIRAVYITPHHHFPTTVIMPIEKRLKLLELSIAYNFAIVEDDYDYDYHYSGSSILPLASLDKSGNVIYIGSFSKILVPSIRIGYMYAHKKIIVETAKLRRIIDKQGDPVIERALAQLFKENEVQRHLKKAIIAYKKRRDLFSSILSDEFQNHIQFEKPEGGMAIWVRFRNIDSVSNLATNARNHGLFLNIDDQISPNSCRLGFASINEQEIKRNLELLHVALG